MPTTTPDDFQVLTRLATKRRTCRQFQPRQVEPHLIETLVQSAQHAPSWCNTQPWQLEITAGEVTNSLRRELAAQVLSAPQAPDFDFPVYSGTYQDRRRACGAQLYESLGIAKADTERRFVQLLRNFDFFDAPHVVIVTTEADLGTYGAIDCGVFLAHFLLCAQALGLGAAPQAAIAPYADFLRDFFGLADNRRVVFGISLGYPDESHPVNGFRTPRAPLIEAVSWHHG